MVAAAPWLRETLKERMRRNRGLTIVECLVAMTILSVVVLVTCHTLAAGHEHVHYGDRRSTAVRIGRDMLEEITARPYRDLATPTHFGPETSETMRTHFDDVDDYHGYAEALGSLTDFAASAYPEHDQAFSRSVTVTAATTTVTDLGRNFPGLSVVVTVRARSGEEWQFSRFIPEPGL
jgi:prepilin-type N-terminal cleavage/methylation domain-containing protein